MRPQIIGIALLVIATIVVATPATAAGDDESAPRVSAPASAEKGSDGTADASHGRTSWPCRVLAGADMLPFVQRAWDKSATFREQCRKLAAAGAVIHLRASSEKGFSGAAAQIGRSPEGLMVAHVRVRLGASTVGLIAHELEHVLERIEGVNHMIEARRGTSKVWWVGGAYETRRAVDAGRRVAGEVEEAMRRHAHASR